ncbi:hypothetical protein KY290_002384 [Solanum tuberosum]|uniref:RING-type domain-containing protein n=1 Tax=Solanum tuberosum TaxID=4113 RepID=A0ABQ7WPX6_SOLTU|nr:hypothetical protein KY290_002384 [Solanum tuberosum]
MANPFRFRVAGIHRQYPDNGGESDAEAGASRVVGLDESTIQSYRKIVVDKNESSCPICLAEYNAGEIAKCMPGCQHCFHIDCVDKWLKLNTTCPVGGIELSRTKWKFMEGKGYNSMVN